MHNIADSPVQRIISCVIISQCFPVVAFSTQAIVHSLAHIESWAIDLSWDIIARFGSHPDYAPYLPRDFFNDWAIVGACMLYCSPSACVQLFKHILPSYQ